MTSVAGTLASALIAADMAGGTDDQKVHAIGIALSQAAGVFEFLSNGSSVKSMHPAGQRMRASWRRVWRWPA